LPGNLRSAASLNFSAPWPLGVFSATTWLNLMTIGACALATPGSATAAARAAAVASTCRRRMVCFGMLVSQGKICGRLSMCSGRREFDFYRREHGRMLMAHKG
jgi:hypothetical protein